MSPKLPKYDYNIFSDPKNTLNAHLQLSDIKDIEVIETEFESTSLVIAYGSDIFFTRVNPDGNFDILSSDFNEYLLVLITVLIAGVLYGIKVYGKSKRAKDLFYKTK